MTQRKNHRLFLLDAYALIFRSFYAFIRNRIVNSKGQNTSAIFGFTLTLEELLKNQDPEYIAVVFDPPGPTFRQKIYEQYKANREETPEDIKKAVPRIKEIIRGFRIPVIEVENFEADDVIGTLAKKAEKSGVTVYMMTPDKDFSQLVSDRIHIYKPGKSGSQAKIIRKEDVKEQFMVEDPQQMIDILALWGDSSDNIPGVEGIGEVTAKKLISRYGSVEKLIDSIGEFTGKQKEKIEQSIPQIKISKVLATIVTDVPVTLDMDKLRRGDPDKETLAEIFDELEFKTIKERIIGIPSAVTNDHDFRQGVLFRDELREQKYKRIEDVGHNYRLVQGKRDMEDLLHKMEHLDAFCFDTETTGLDPMTAEITGISFSWEDHEAYYVPMEEDRQQVRKKLEKFDPLFRDAKKKKIGQNLKYDIQILAGYGIEVCGELFDTMIAHYVLRPELKHNLDDMARTMLGYSPVPIESLIGEKGKRQINMRDVPLRKVCDYACEDADIAWQLASVLDTKLHEKDLVRLSEEIEMPLIGVLARMERAGFKLDIEGLQTCGKQLEEEIRSLEEEITGMAGESFNISSPRQLGVILFEKLKIQDKAKKTRTRQYSTSEEVLEALSGKHPIVNKVLLFRTLKKLLSTYVEALPRLVNPQTGKIHTSFNQALTSTGRLSSNKPNLQNIPVREERGREIRKTFVPSAPENILFSADYSQIELRLMAHMSRDPSMINAFNAQEDIHMATASKIFDVRQTEVTREMRSAAKTANFGIIYGISAFGLSQRLKIPRKEAGELIDGYFRSYPGVREYMDQVIRRAREEGFVSTLFGRKRYLKDINSRNSVVRGFAERNAINAPLQGTAADIIKKAMVNIDRRIKERSLQTNMILQVHDELIFDVPEKELDAVREMVVWEMENVVNLEVPLKVDWGTGNNWLEAH